jgi:hypothetical protein
VPSATAFGLDLDSETTLPFLEDAGEGAGPLPTGRPLWIAYGEAAPPWPRQARLVSDERGLDGEVIFQIEAGEPGYRFQGPAYGCTVLSADGTEAQGAPGEGGFGGWQRLLVAQVLPFAAALQGLEGLLAHPGAPISGIDLAEAERLGTQGERERTGVLAVNAREQVARAALAPGPVPLGALFLLDPRREGPEQPSFEAEGDPRQLLAATFNLLLASPERLAGLLDVCARLAARRVERVTFGPATDPDELAAAIWARLSK